jgi:hypothetical protein
MSFGVDEVIGIIGRSLDEINTEHGGGSRRRRFLLLAARHRP